MTLTHLIDLSRRFLPENSSRAANLPGLTLYRRTAVSDIEATIYDPVICLILQGSKVTSTEEQSVELRPGDALLVSHALPVTSRITRASRTEPYLALILSLDQALVRGLYDQLADAPRPAAPASGSSPRARRPAWPRPTRRPPGPTATSRECA